MTELVAAAPPTAALLDQPAPDSADLGRELVASALLVVLCFASSALLVGAILALAWLLS